MNIVVFVKNLVEEAGSQTAVARKCGLSQGTIHKLINADHQPDLMTIHKISSAYGLSISSFVDDIDRPISGNQIDRIEQLLMRVLAALNVKEAP